MIEIIKRNRIATAFVMSVLFCFSLYIYVDRTPYDDAKSKQLMMLHNDLIDLGHKYGVDLEGHQKYLNIK